MSREDNAAVLTKAYGALQRRDAAALNAAYADDATFEDPVFGKLDAAGARKMWSTLLKGETLKMTFTVTPTDDGGTVQWVADYVLGRRPVHNEITSVVVLRDGKISRQRDTFDFSKWVRQAVGGPVAVLAGNPLTKWLAQSLIRSKVRKRCGI
ncbi:MAG: nuclear transport factor 2 family protein [Myxococcota bacterium]|nr:nuclear transport factor 2 family protein [Myxococcota bacterium]